ncbi:TniQ family protein [Aliarcobacter butzleri]|uniref:TniQ family protein n=1 Tax=Aliarcobacter butzleri TaxID=28197 RepID=UPI00125FEBED|nr:TniQ family protein [Aliarcobacter butzleri]
MKILIEPKPFKDESFVSWFCRTAFSNGTDPKSFALSIWNQDSMFYRDLDRFIPNENANDIEKTSLLSKNSIKWLTLEPLIDEVDTSKSENQYKKWYFLLPLAQKGKLRTNGIHFCPKCLKSKTPYVNKFWRLSWFIICPIHKIKLLSNCPKCNHIFAPEKQDYLHPYMYLCCQCKYDLRETELKPINEKLLSFQKKLTNIFANKTTNFSFNLLITKSKKDLFLTINILLSFVYKVLRQPIRFNKLIQALELQIQHEFISIHNGTFSRLNSTDRYVLLKIIYKILCYTINDFIYILKQSEITQNILQQTFKTLSPTIVYIKKHLSNKKLKRNTSKPKRLILPKTQDEVLKLFKEISPYLTNRFRQ